MTDTAKQAVSRGRFVKGTSGNPAGRPKGLPSVARYLRERPAKDQRKLAELLWTKALEGDKWAIEYLINRLEGTPVQTQFQAQIKDIPVILGWEPPGSENGANDGAATDAGQEGA